MRKINTKRQTEIGKKRAAKALKRKAKNKELAHKREMLKVQLRRDREKAFNEYLQKLLESRNPV